MVPCQSLKSGLNGGIHYTAQCESNVVFNCRGTPKIQENVVIGYGSRIGCNLVAHAGAMFSDMVVTANLVEIGYGACVEGGKMLQPEMQVPDTAKAWVVNGRLMVLQQTPGFKYVLQNGACELVPK